ncbi:MAG: aminotransferase class I/II-fold pyridoxal phosphate-dependent enzyme [Phormidesmis sp.]
MNPLDQLQTPLVSALQICANRANAAFHTPGHKRGQGISDQHCALFGTKVFRADLPELPELDNLFAPEGVILAAQQLAAEAFGAEQTWFLANGSTCGIEAAILATCGPSDQLILPRNVHVSAISGLILSGATPIYLPAGYGQEWDMPLAVTPDDVMMALDAHPEAKAVLVVSPTYYGICSDLGAIAQLTHAHNIPLIVDEAHAPHFTFHPDFPPSALKAGADIVIQSAHKVLSAFTQAALLHTQGDRIDRNRIIQSLQLTQSTSPSYLLLGSLDAARHQMATEGFSNMARTLDLADRASRELRKLKGLKVGRWGDRTRITVEVSGLGLTGFQADELLHERFGVTAELPALRHLMFLITLGNTHADIDRLIEGFKGLCELHPPINVKLGSSKSFDLPISQFSARQTPRQAFFAPKIALPFSQACGHICAETICPYPPGIPVLLPGEPVTTDALSYLKTIQAAGGIITGCRDPDLKTILVIQSAPAAPC